MRMPVLGRSCRPLCLLDRHEPVCSNTAASWPFGGVTPGAPPALPALPDRPPAVAADWRAVPLPAHRCLQRPCRPTGGKPGQSNPTDVMHNDQSTYQLTYDELIGHTT